MSANTKPPVDPRAWTRDSLDESQWRISVSPECLEELSAVISHLSRHPLPLLLLAADDFPLAACRTLTDLARERLDAGPGVVVLDRFLLSHGHANILRPSFGCWARWLDVRWCKH